MPGEVTTAIRLSLLDLSALAVDGPARPATFGVIQQFDGSVEIEGLREGARRAMGVFPRSSCSLRRGLLHPHPAEPAISELRFEGDAEKAPESAAESAAESEIEAFLSAEPDPEEFPLIRQILVHSGGKSRLVTRIHHVLCDGIAGLQWLSVQARVAAGLPVEVDVEVDSTSAPRLRQFRGSKQRHSSQPSSYLQSRGWKKQPTSPTKRFRTLWIDEEPLRARLRESRAAVTLNDWLCAQVFEAMGEALPEARQEGAPGLSLWIPLSLRRDPFSYFGNASSRIRLHAPQRGSDSQSDLSRAVHQAMEAALESGGWDVGTAALPAGPLVSSIPPRVVVAGLRAYFARPGMDPCTSAFSFASRVSRLEDADAFPGVERMETVGQLHRAHSFALSGLVFGGKVALTCFWDPARFAAGPDALLAALARRTGL